MYEVAKITWDIMKEVKFMQLNLKAIKVVGIVASVLGVAATLVGNWAGEQQQNARIDEKVTEKVTALLENKNT